MKDIPIFTSEYGAASLVLREIPYRQRAYITILDSLAPALLLEECMGFCRACGAEMIFASGHPYLQQYPLTAEVVQMQAVTEAVASADAHLIPVTKETAGLWRQISNEHMEAVPMAAYLSASDEAQLISCGTAYFVYKAEKMVGIGKVTENLIEQVVSLDKGAGEFIVRALASTVAEHTVSLSVASANERAVKLYRRLGFSQTGVLLRWHRIL